MDAHPPVHDRHDLMLVAALAAGDASGREREDAEALVVSCADCALLLADLQAIGTATAALPPVPRTRDFRLTDADAARLRPSGWRRAVAWFRGGGSAAGRGGALRPLAVGLTTLGIVGLVFSATPLAGGLGSTASAPQALSESANGRNAQVVSGAADAASAAPPALGPVQGAGGAGVGSGAQASAAATAAPVAIPQPAASAVAPDAGGGSGSDKGAAAPPSEAPPVPGPTAGPATDFIAGAPGSPSPVPGQAPGTDTTTGSSWTTAPILAIGSLGCIVLGVAMLIVVRRRAKAETES